jgi:hypothetical protein
MNDLPAEHFRVLHIDAKPDLKETADRVAAQFKKNPIGDGCAAASQLEYEASIYQFNVGGNVQLTQTYINGVAAELEKQKLLPVVEIAAAKLQKEEEVFLQSHSSSAYAQHIKTKMQDAGVHIVETLAISHVPVKSQDYGDVLNQLKQDYREKHAQDFKEKKPNSGSEKNQARTEERKNSERTIATQGAVNSKPIAVAPGVQGKAQTRNLLQNTEQSSKQASASSDPSLQLEPATLPQSQQKSKPQEKPDSIIVDAQTQNGKTIQDADINSKVYNHSSTTDGLSTGKKLGTASNSGNDGNLRWWLGGAALVGGLGLWAWSRGRVNPSAVAAVEAAGENAIALETENPALITSLAEEKAETTRKPKELLRHPDIFKPALKVEPKSGNVSKGFRYLREAEQKAKSQANSIIEENSSEK